MKDMKDFFPIETPYSSEEYKLIKDAVNQGIDSRLEAFTKSKFGKSTNFNNKFLWDIHMSELPILYRRLEDLYDKTGNEDYLSLVDDIKYAAEKDDDVNIDDLEVSDMSTRMENENIENFIDDDTVKQELASENSSDSLTNQHGKNLKPLSAKYDKDTELDEDSQKKRHLAGQRGKDFPLGQHAPNSQAANYKNKK